MIDEVIEKCKQLRLKACGQNIAQVIEMASREKLVCPENHCLSF